MPSKFVQCYSRYIDFCYEIFDRILLKGYIPLVQRENGMVYFLKEIRGIKCISTEALRNLTMGFIQRVKCYAEEKQIPVVIAERGASKLEIAEKYDFGQEGVVCILKSKEWGRIFYSYEIKKKKIKITEG